MDGGAIPRIMWSLLVVAPPLVPFQGSTFHVVFEARGEAAAFLLISAEPAAVKVSGHCSWLITLGGHAKGKRVPGANRQTLGPYKEPVCQIRSRLLATSAACWVRAGGRGNSKPEKMILSPDLWTLYMSFIDCIAWDRQLGIAFITCTFF